MRNNDILDGKDEFAIWTPSCVQILMKSGEDIERTRPIGGICSTETLDRQNESVFAKGLDFTEFVKFGYFNDNHKQNTADILGYPNKAELRGGRWWTEGNLLLDWEPANRVWALAKALAKSTLKRRLGFSIEGKITERGYDNRVLKAIIRHVAITNSPVNTDCTWDILAKAFGSLEELEANRLRLALSAGASSPAVSGGAALRGSSKPIEREPLALTIDEAVKILKSRRPQYSWSTCERLARIIFKQERRN